MMPRTSKSAPGIAVRCTFMRKPGMSATATRDSGQNTSFSVGFSGSGSKGSFTDSGSFSWSSDLTVQFDTFRGPSSQLYQSQFTPGLYKELIPT